ncbi:hypothetical protein ACVITL_002523 [Rhizobium pisi]
MMSTHERIGRPDIAWSAEGAGSGGGEPENILFPADVPQQRTDGGEGYQADPGKADGENALAKAERDGEGEAARGEADRVPEDGKYTLTMPDGIAVDEELLGALGPDFRELGLTNGEAQKLADRFIAIQAGRAEARGRSGARRFPNGPMMPRPIPRSAEGAGTRPCATAGASSTTWERRHCANIWRRVVAATIRSLFVSSQRPERSSERTIRPPAAPEARAGPLIQRMFFFRTMHRKAKVIWQQSAIASLS